MASFIKILTEQNHPEWEDNIDSMQLWRAAIQGRLDADKTHQQITRPPKYAAIASDARRIGDASGNDRQGRLNNWLYRFEYESDWAYEQRLLLSHDFGDSGRVVSSYVGHMSRAPHDIRIELRNEDINQKVMQNVDNDFTSIKVFENEVEGEVLGMGKAWVITKANAAGIPYSQIIPREDVLDWDVDIDGNLVFCKYTEILARVVDFERVWVEKITMITQQDVFTAERRLTGKDGDWTLLEPVPNTLGMIPVTSMCLGADARPIIEVIAKIQVNLMNADSEVRQLIRNQCLSILQIPNGAAEQIEALSANSYIEVSPEDANTAKWVGYPGASLDPYFKYLQEWLSTRIMEASNLRRREDTNTSGVSKQWDFMETTTVLSQLCDAVEPGMRQVIEHWAAWQDVKNPEIIYEIEKKFDDKKLAEKLDNIIKAMTLDVGPTATKKIRESVISEMVKLEPEEQAQVDEELEALRERELNPPEPMVSFEAISEEGREENE